MSLSPPPSLTSPSCAADASSMDVLFDRGMVGILVDRCLKEYVHNVALSEACLRTLVALAGAQRARRRLLHMGTVFRVTTALQVRGGHKDRVGRGARCVLFRYMGMLEPSGGCGVL